MHASNLYYLFAEEPRPAPRRSPSPPPQPAAVQVGLNASQRRRRDSDTRDIREILNNRSQAAPAPAPRPPPVTASVNRAEINAMLDLLRVEPLRREIDTPPSIVPSLESAGDVHRSGASVLKVIKGLLFVRIIRIEPSLCHPDGKAINRLPSLPTVEVKFEGEGYITQAARGDDCHFDDEEVILPVEHFYGGAMLTLNVAVRSVLPLFGTKYGQASVSVGEIVANQVWRIICTLILECCSSVLLS